MLKSHTLNKTNKRLMFKALIIAGTSFSVYSQDYIKPAMVNIPGGTTSIGSLLSDKRVNPVKSITVPDFQLGKFPVTVAEYRLFIEDTNYASTQVCYDDISATWFGGPDSKGSASWDEHRFLQSEYQPVTCVNYKDMLAYADWISKKTGVKYRLPNENEWAYAEKGNTNGKHFWGDDLNKEDACLYGNFADKSGEYHASKDYGASYSGFMDIVNCDDGEPYNSIVGLYRPNPFGLYDMMGNVSQYLASCYYDGFETRTEEEMDINKCEYITHRVESWHYPATPHTDRGRAKREGDNSWALTGFRLATEGHSYDKAPSTKQFELALKKAQQKRLNERVKLPLEPQNVFLSQVTGQQYQLTWQPSEDESVTHYEIYQSKSVISHQRQGFFKNYFDKLETVSAEQNAIKINLPREGASYKVVSVAGDITSLPSKTVVKIKPRIINLPGKLSIKDNSSLKNVSIDYRKANKKRPEIYDLYKFNPGYEPTAVSVNFDVKVDSTGWYSVNYHGSSVIKGEMFKMWLNNTYLGSLDYDKEIDDKASNRHKVYLTKGEHQLQLTSVKESFDVWSLVWLEFSKIDA